MWQILLGIYIIVVTLSILVLWSSLVLARESDHKIEIRTRLMTGLTVGD